jgi:hypothetical protein
MAAEVIYPKQFFPTRRPAAAELPAEPALAVVLQSLPQLLRKTRQRVESGDAGQLRAAILELKCLEDYFADLEVFDDLGGPRA